MEKSYFTDSQMIAVLKQPWAGTPVPALCREHGISSAMFYKWRSKFSGMEVSMVGRMKELDKKNRHLKKMYAEAQLSADLLKEALSRKSLGDLCAGRWPRAFAQGGRTSIRCRHPGSHAVLSLMRGSCSGVP